MIESRADTNAERTLASGRAYAWRSEGVSRASRWPGHVAGSRLTVKPISSTAELDALAPAWDALLARSRANAVFLTFDWIRTWVDHFLDGRRTLFVLRIDDGTDLVGIAPFCIRRVGPAPLCVRRLEFLGLPEMGSDYLDVVSASGREGDVAAALYDALFGQLAAAWDLLCLKDIPAQSAFLLHLLTLASSERRYVQIAPGSVCPQVTLPHDSSVFVATVAPKRQKIAARDWRRLERRGTVEHLTGDGSSADSALMPLLDLYARVWGKRLPRHAVPFLRDLAARWGGTGRIETDFLSIDGRPLGGLLHLRYGDVLHMYAHVVDRQGARNVNAGALLIQRAMARAHRQRLSTYDFLKGAEPYKFIWANRSVQCLTIRMYRKRIGAIALAWAALLKDMIRVLVR